MDRIANLYLEQDLSRSFSSNFPLRPFVDGATRLVYDDPRTWRYLTIGDMAKPTTANRFRYALPATPDYLFLHRDSLLKAGRPSGGTSLAQDFPSQARVHKVSESERKHAQVERSLSPYILFTGVVCLGDSFQIDVFIDGPDMSIPDPIANPCYIGRITRLGMETGRGGDAGLRNTQRCDKKAISRVLSAAHVGDKLAAGATIHQTVTELHTGRIVDEHEWKKYPGFCGQLIWMEDCNVRP